eukprot:6772125-Alexandrium_andersonii.AAC.1
MARNEFAQPVNGPTAHGQLHRTWLRQKLTNRLAKGARIQVAAGRQATSEMNCGAHASARCVGRASTERTAAKTRQASGNAN